jgi:hypothetical protein
MCGIWDQGAPNQTVGSARLWPRAGAPVDEINATLLTFKISSLADRFRAGSFESWPSSVGHQLPLTLANWMTAMWPIAVIRPADLSDSNAAVAAVHGQSAMLGLLPCPREALITGRMSPDIQVCGT